MTSPNDSRSPMLRISPEQLARIGNVTRQRERDRIVEELAGRQAVELSMGNLDVASVIGEIIESLSSASIEATSGASVHGAQRRLTDAEAVREGERLLVPGLESAPFAGYDADESALPPVVEHDDEADALALARRWG